MSSDKTNSSGLQTNQAPDNTSGATHNSYILSQRGQNFESETPGFLATNPQDFRSTDSTFGSTGAIPNRPLPTVPPSLPQQAHGECFKFVNDSKIVFQ